MATEVDDITIQYRFMHTGAVIADPIPHEFDPVWIRFASRSDSCPLVFLIWVFNGYFISANTIRRFAFNTSNKS